MGTTRGYQTGFEATFYEASHRLGSWARSQQIESQTDRPDIPDRERSLSPSRRAIVRSFVISASEASVGTVFTASARRESGRPEIFFWKSLKVWVRPADGGR
jgi:hypothetical protein